MHLFSLCGTRDGPSALPPREISEATLVEATLRRRQLTQLIDKELAEGDKTGAQTQSIPARFFEILSPREILQVQALLVSRKLKYCFRDGGWPEARRQVQGLVEDRTKTIPYHHLPISIAAPSIIPGRTNFPHLSGKDCSNLLNAMRADVQTATEAVSGANNALSAAADFLQAGNATTSPQVQCVDANEGLQQLNSISGFVDQAAAAAKNSELLLFVAEHGDPPCNPDAVAEMKNLVNLVNNLAQEANSTFSNVVTFIYYLSLYGSLQQMQASCQAPPPPPPPSSPPPPSPPSPKCFVASWAWGWESDITLDENCTQELINFLRGGGALVGISAAITSALGAPYVGAMLAILAGYAALIAADMSQADNANHQGVTLHFSPFAYAAFTPAGELVTLTAELADPGFGNYWISAMWITGN